MWLAKRAVLGGLQALLGGCNEHLDCEAAVPPSGRSVAAAWHPEQPAATMFLQAVAELEGAHEGLAGMFEDSKQRSSQGAQQAQQAQVQRECAADLEAGKPPSGGLAGNSKAAVAGASGTLGEPPIGGSLQRQPAKSGPSSPHSHPAPGSPHSQRALSSPRSQHTPSSPRSQHAPSSPRSQLSPAEAAALHARLEQLSLSRLSSMRLTFRGKHTPPMFCFELAVRSFAWSKYAYRHWVSRSPVVLARHCIRAGSGYRIWCVLRLRGASMRAGTG